jgi:CubicO group peptidase (beta-lactamase class C family)
LALAVIVSAGSAVAAGDWSASADSLVRQFAHDKGIPGIAVAVGKDKVILWSAGIGEANLENHAAVSADRTKFRIGSASKSLTSLGLARLIESGKLQLDVPIQEYVPQFPKKPEGEVSVRLLAGHLAGIRNYRDIGELGNAKSYSNVGEAVAFFKDDALVAAPGSRFSYSTYGYTLLSAAMEAASGRPYLTYMEESVFGPLGMKGTTADVPSLVIADRSGFYYRDGGELLNAPYIDNSNKWAGGGYLSTAHDLVRFGLAFFDVSVIKPETRDLLWTSQMTTGGERTMYGIGWFVGKDSQGHAWVQHPGGAAGGSALIRIYPEQKLVISLLTNLSMIGDDRFSTLPDQLFTLFSGN